MKLALLALATLALPTAARADTCARKPELMVQRVDDGTKEMTALAAEAKSDKTAVAAGITAEIDQWKSGSTIGVDSYVKGTDHDKLVEWLGRHMKAYDVAGVHSVQLGEVMDGTQHYWRSYYVRMEAIVTEREIVAARFVTPTPTNPGLEVTLTDKGKTAFASATKAAKDHKLAILLVGKGVVAAPIINGEVAGGKFMLTTPGTTAERTAEAKKLADLLNCKP